MRLFLVEVKHKRNLRWNKLIAVHARDVKQMRKEVDRHYNGKREIAAFKEVKAPAVVVHLPTAFYGLSTKGKLLELHP